MSCGCQVSSSSAPIYKELRAPAGPGFNAYTPVASAGCACSEGGTTRPQSPFAGMAPMSNPYRQMAPMSMPSGVRPMSSMYQAPPTAWPPQPLSYMRPAGQTVNVSSGGPSMTDLALLGVAALGGWWLYKQSSKR